MGITDLLSKVVVKRELDLSELDEAYTYTDEDGNKHPIKLPFCVNWPRRIKKQMHDLRHEVFEIQQALEDIDADAEDAEERAEALSARADNVAQDWIEWWAEVLMMEPAEVGQLQAAVPGGHWDWITGQIRQRVGAYEADATKKAIDALSPTSEEPEASRQKSSSGQK
jgi:hypothetical protein